MMRLIVVADDLGYCTRRDEGIFQAFRQGIVTQASLLVNGASAADAAATAVACNLPLSLHFNVTEGIPVAPADCISSLLDETGHFHPKARFCDFVDSGHINTEHVIAELFAQLDRFAALVGRRARHVDGHNHVLALAHIATAAAPRLRGAGLASIRAPQHPRDEQHEALSPYLQRIAGDADKAVEIYRTAGLRVADRFLGLALMGRALSEHALVSALLRAEQSGASSCELMTHPGWRSVDQSGGCGMGPDEFSQSEDREHELHALCAPSLRQALADMRICLSSFDDL